MQNKSIATIAAAIAAAVALSGCGNSDRNDANSAAPAQTAPTQVDADTQGSHNQADVDFARGMIPHHEQAVEMSDIMLAKQDIDPRVAQLAEEIKAAQGPEIEEMRGWLTEWGVAPTSASGAMPSMPGHDMGDMPGHDMGDMPGHDMGDMPGHDMGDMHGMMSEQDIAALRGAQGTEANRMFLTQMIQHHEGAVTMAQTEVDSGHSSGVVDLARGIITSQQQEIDRMREILQSL